MNIASVGSGVSATSQQDTTSQKISQINSQISQLQAQISQLESSDSSSTSESTIENLENQIENLEQKKANLEKTESSSTQQVQKKEPTGGKPKEGLSINKEEDDEEEEEGILNSMGIGINYNEKA